MPKVKHLFAKIAIALMATLAYFLLASPVAANAQAVECIDEQNCADIAECSVLPPSILTVVQDGEGVQISYDNNSCEGDYDQQFFLGTPNEELGCVVFGSLFLGENKITAPATNKTVSFAIQNVTKPIDGTAYCVFGRTVYFSDNEEATTQDGNDEVFTYKQPAGATIVLGATTEELADTGAESLISQAAAFCLILTSLVIFKRPQKL